MADTTYQPGVYHKQGGDELVIASGGKLTIESGSSCTIATAFEFGTGGYPVYPVQALTTADTATAILAYGITTLVATTAGPTYTLAAPTVAGMSKDICIMGNTSGATTRAVINANTTGTSFESTGSNVLTLTRGTLEAVSLRSISTSAWKVVGAYTGASLGLSAKAT